jgi:hypothetical protein
VGTARLGERTRVADHGNRILVAGRIADHSISIVSPQSRQPVTLGVRQHDLDSPQHNEGNTMADDFTLEGPKWGASEAGTAGGTVTWAVDSSIPAADLANITAAFAEWAKVANIQFQEVASTATANIDFSEGAIDGAGNVLADTGFSFSGGQMQHANVEFDSGDTLNGANLTLVAAHEIGHAIGLGHFDAAPAVMNSAANFSLTGLQQSDIDGIQAIYGANTATTSDAGTTPTAADPATGDTGASGTSGTPASGTTATNPGSGAAAGCAGTATASGDGGTATGAAAGTGAGDGSSHHDHGGDHGGQFANNFAALLHSLQSGNTSAGTEPGSDHGAPLGNDIAGLLHALQGGNTSAVTASNEDVHNAMPADMSTMTHAHFEHMWG